MKQLVMIGTRPDTMGGIAAVVNVYREAGLFERHAITYIPTHRDGSAAAKLAVLAAAWWCYAWLLLRGRIGLLHVHMSSRASFWRKALFLWPAYGARVPALIHLHGSEFAVFFERECRPWQRRLVRATFRRASRVIVLSAGWQAWVRQACPEAFTEVLYNPVMVPPPAAWDARQAGAVLALGRVGKRKGSYDLLSAVASLSPSLPQLRLMVGGDGELSRLQQEAARAGVGDRLQLLGWVRGAEKQAVLDAAMVYCLPSYHEGLPMSVLEAMASGLPVVSTPVGGIPEAVTEGVEGFLVAPGDVAALAERLARLVGAPDLARRMGEAARRRVQGEFSAQALLPRLERLYREFGFGA